MKAMVLIAASVVRQQRWPLVLLLGWLIASAALTAGGAHDLFADDVSFLYRQQAAYGVAFALILSTSALYNERRSRRILLVLSKAVTRSQYLGGLLLGVVFSLTAYGAAMGVAGEWMFAQAHLPVAAVWPVAVSVVAACVLTASLAVFYATFMSPFFCVAATAVTLALPGALAQLAAPAWESVLPVFPLMTRVMGDAGMNRLPQLILLAIAQSVALWVLASWIFSRRDIAVALE